MGICDQEFLLLLDESAKSTKQTRCRRKSESKGSVLQVLLWLITLPNPVEVLCNLSRFSCALQVNMHTILHCLADFFYFVVPEYIFSKFSKNVANTVGIRIVGLT